MWKMPERKNRQPQPFARRIVIAFTLMTFVVSGTMSLCLVYAVHFFEKELVSRALESTLNRVLDEDLSEGRAPRLDSDTWFFASDRMEYAIPEQFAQVKPGFSEWMSGDEDYYVYVRKTGEQRYILVQNQQDFERNERTLFLFLFAGFVCTVVGAWALGRLTAKRIMAPIRRLAQEVRQRALLQKSVAPMAEHYANDEIGHLAEAFDSSLRRLGEALERERLFTSDVSHELRTPLMIIATSCELLATGDLSPREREQIERIARAAEEMRSLSETFLALARSTSEDREQKTEGSMGTLAAIAEEQYARWLPEMRQKGLEFERHAEAATQTKPLNAILLRAVLGNLLRNAWHYTEQGWVRLILDADGFTVEDSGVGIPEPEKTQVFRAFARGAQARGEGFGLGLSLVRRICASQGWEITLNGLPEGGSRFSVRFFPDA